MANSARHEPSFSQERLWFLSKFETEENTAYNSTSAFRLVGRLNTGALQMALDEIYRRHEVLRSVIEEQDGRPVQVVTPVSRFPFELVDLSDTQNSDHAEELEEAIRERQQFPFNLSQGPLVRGTLIRVSADEYIFMAVFHHIVTDGWSGQIFRTELSTLYSAYVMNQPSSLEPLTAQYSDFARWQRSELTGENLERKLTFWSEHLESPRATLDLPFDRPRPANQTFNGAIQSFELTPDLSTELRLLSRKQGATLFMILLAAFKTFLYRYSGEMDVIVGTPAANRLSREYEAVIGFFANTLALRTDLSDDPSFTNLIGRVRESLLESLEHQDMPFELLVAELLPERDLSRNPLFQVMFALQNVPRGHLDLPGLSIDPYHVNSNTAKFDLTLYVFDEPNYLRGSFEYNTDLFDATTINQMITHFTTLLESAVAIPEEKISRLRLLTSSELVDLTHGFNKTEADYDKNICIHEVVSCQVVRTPDRVAVEDGESKMTYAELDERSNRLARYLSQNGVSAGDLVGICINRSAKLVYGFLGILKTGAAYVPLDPEYPARRLSYMIADAGVKLILTEEELIPLLGHPDVELVCLNRDAVAIDSRDSDPLNVHISSSSLAYVIYTSGTTGRPKGVEISHRAFVNLLLSLQQEPGFTPEDVMLSITTPSFDIAGVELFLPLISGGRTVVLPGKLAGDGAALSLAIDRYNATVLQATPTTWRLLVDSGWKGRPGLRMFCGGETLTRSLAQELNERGAELWNMYGPTESTVYSCIEKVPQEVDVVAIGKPVANTQLYVLDANLEPVPIGVEGTLYIGGDGLSSGYLNKEKLTNEVFIANPFGEGRIYESGDRARRTRDGRVICLGREDHQVKLRGFRIELGEIEHAIVQHEHIRNCIVVLREDIPGEKRLVAYVVADDRPDLSALNRLLREQLPEYMVPSAIMFLNELPRTPSGKIDRRALPKPEEIRPELAQSFVGPTTRTETALAEIWSEVLKIDQPGIDDNFFELGGHSLSAIQVHSRIALYLETDISLRAIFEHPTISRLAEFLDSNR